MPQPTEYVRNYDFTGYQEEYPNQPLPAAPIDANLDMAGISISQIIARLSIIQRDDGALRNQKVTVDSLANDVKALLGTPIDPRGDWVAITAYKKWDLVSANGATWICAVPHTSNVLFAPDRDLGYWVLFSNPAVDDGNSFFQKFSGTGAQTVFTLTDDLGTDPNALLVFYNDGGAEQFQIVDPTVISLDHQYLTFDVAPVLGSNNIWVFAPAKLLASMATYVAEAAASAAEAAATVVLLEGQVDAAELFSLQSKAASLSSDAYSQAAALRWVFKSAVAITDPGSNAMTFNNADMASASVLAISNYSNNTGAPYVKALLESWDDSTSSIKGQLTIRSITNLSTFVTYNITGAVTPDAAFTQIPVLYIAANGVFANNEEVAVSFARAGDPGTIGGSVITSSSATAWAIGPAGATNPAFVVDASAAVGVNGWKASNAASGSAPTFKTTGPGANVDGSIGTQGNGNLTVYSGNYLSLGAGNTNIALSGGQMNISNSYRAYTAAEFILMQASAGVNLNAANIKNMYLNFSATQTRTAGNFALQTDVDLVCSTHAAYGASVITDTIGKRITAPRAGANVTFTNVYGLYVDTVNVANGGAVGTSYSAVFNANTGATTNYGTSVLGGKSLFAPCTTGYGSINLAPGTAPSSPINGDIWLTTAGIFARVNGVTVRLASSADCFTGEIDTAQNRDYTFCLVAPYAGTITSFITQSASGTCTAALKNAAGTVATNAVSTSLVNNTTLTSPTFAAGEKLYITISSNAAAKAVAFVANFSRTSL